MNQPCDNLCYTCDPLPGGIGTNPIFPDPNASGNPFVNYSSERPDVDIFIGVWYPPPGLPPLGTTWLATSCAGICTSTVSQADADACAQRASLVCTGTDWPVTIPNPGVDGPVPPGFPPPPPTITVPRGFFANTLQVCPATCPDGNGFLYAIPANTYFGFTQAEADALARNKACVLANDAVICISELSPVGGCVNTLMTLTSSINSAGSGFSAALVQGALPPGMTLSLSGHIITLSGAPTVAGTYIFVVHVEDNSGNFMNKELSVTVLNITTSATLPSTLTDTPYFTLLHATGVDSVVWSLVSGALPAGIFLDTNTGTLGGTPNAAGDYAFTIAATSPGGAVCAKAFTLNITEQEECTLLDDLDWTLEPNPDPYPSSVSAAGNAFALSITSNGNGPDEQQVAVQSEFVWNTPDATLFEFIMAITLQGRSQWHITVARNDFFDIIAEFVQNSPVGGGDSVAPFTFGLSPADVGSTIIIRIVCSTTFQMGAATSALSGTVECSGGAFANTEQSATLDCPVDCPGTAGQGNVPAGYLARATQAEADAAALAIAQQEAFDTRQCCCPTYAISFSQSQVSRLPHMTQNGALQVTVRAESPFGPFEYNDYDLRINVPFCALPPGTTQARVQIQVSGLSASGGDSTGSIVLTPSDGSGNANMFGNGTLTMVRPVGAGGLFFTVEISWSGTFITINPQCVATVSFL